MSERNAQTKEPSSKVAKAVERAETPRGFRKAWATTYRKTDRDAYPHLHFVGVKGRIGRRFFDLSLGWGKKHNDCHPSVSADQQPALSTGECRG